MNSGHAETQLARVFLGFTLQIKGVYLRDSISFFIFGQSAVLIVKN